MENFIVIVGMGQLGSLFAQGFLKLGYLVMPVLRSMPFPVFEGSFVPQCIVVCVDIGDLVLFNCVEDLTQQVLSNCVEDLTQQVPRLTDIPTMYLDRVVFVQNELLPIHIQSFVTNLNVIVVWLEKKGYLPPRLRSFSPELFYTENNDLAQLLQHTMDVLGIPCRRVKTKQNMVHCMMMKNIYNLVMNVAGLALGQYNCDDADAAGADSTFRDLLADEPLLSSLVQEALVVQTTQEPHPVDQHRIVEHVLRYIHQTPKEQRCQGRYATQRLQRTIERMKDHLHLIPSMLRIHRTHVRDEDVEVQQILRV